MWDEDEIKNYRQVDYAPLQELYASMGIPKTDPERRAEFLTEDVIDLTHADQDAIMLTAASLGNDIGLNGLEQMAIALHKEGKIDFGEIAREKKQ